MTTQDAMLILNPETSRDALIMKSAHALEKAAGIDLATLTRMFQAGYTLTPPTNEALDSFIRDYVFAVNAGFQAMVDQRVTCAGCSLAIDFGDPTARMCGTENIVRSVDFSCSNAMRRKGKTND